MMAGNFLVFLAPSCCSLSQKKCSNRKLENDIISLSVEHVRTLVFSIPTIVCCGACVVVWELSLYDALSILYRFSM
jgi:hypothetical protein